MCRMRYVLAMLNHDDNDDDDDGVYVKYYYLFNRKCLCDLATLHIYKPPLYNRGLVHPIYIKIEYILKHGIMMIAI